MIFEKLIFLNSVKITFLKGFGMIWRLESASAYDKKDINWLKSFLMASKFSVGIWH